MKSRLTCMKRRVESGFTLIELLIVVAVIGVLIALVAPSMMTSKEAPKGKVLVSVANDMNNNWLHLTNMAGQPRNTTNLSAAGVTYGQILITGKNAMLSSLSTTWDDAGLLPIAAATSEATGTCAGGFRVQGFCGTFTPFANSATVSYQSVNAAVALAAVKQLDPNITSSTMPAAAGNAAGNAISWGAPSNSLYTITLNFN